MVNWFRLHPNGPSRRWRQVRVLCFAVTTSLLSSHCGHHFHSSGQLGPQGKIKELSQPDLGLWLQGGDHFDSDASENRTQGTASSEALQPLLSGDIRFNTQESADGALNVTVSGPGTLAVTTDGSLPDLQNPNDNTIISENSVSIVLTRPTILRATLTRDNQTSELRSQSFIPKIIDIEVAQVPPELASAELYVTGAFRGWSETLDENFRLRRDPDGRRRIRIRNERDGRFVYKFIASRPNGTTVWWADPSSPRTGVGDFENNFAPPALQILGRQFIRNSPGFIEEAALDLRLQPVAALDQPGRTVRVRIGFIEGDVSAAELIFPNGQSVALEKSRYSRAEIPFEQFTGHVVLPEENTRTGFLVRAVDGDRQLRLGLNGLLQSGENISEDNTFPFVFNATEETLNGQEIYQIPLWAVDANWYQIFPERFRNGDTANDAPGPLPYEWNEFLGSDIPDRFQSVREWTSDWFQFDSAEAELEEQVMSRVPDSSRRDVQRQIVLNRRYGGDLEGLRSQISYLRDLGITAVYLNPVFESDSNHKYDTKDYRHIDRHFGPMRRNRSGEAQLFRDDRQLLAREDLSDPSTWGYTRADKLFMQTVSELQENGIRVVIDGVFNHSAANSAFMEDIARNGRNSEFFPWFEMAYVDEPEFEALKCRLSDFYLDEREYPEAANVAFEAWFGYCTLPNHRENFEQTVFHPGFKEYLDNIIRRWMEPKTVDGISYNGVDGFRLDVYGDVSQEYWKLFRQTVKGIKKDALIIAEEWYDGFEILRGDQTDVLMNYTARSLIESWFINTSERDRFRPSMATDRIEFQMNNYREHVKHGLWTMLESHDTDRLLSKTLFANRGLSPRPQDGNSWDDGSVNRPDLGAPYSNDKPGVNEREFYKGILGFQMGYLGAPIVYYGAEWGMWGSDDPTDRKPMMWPDLFDGSDTETRCITYPGLWCRLQPDVTFTMEPDFDMFATHSRMANARLQSKALRRGALNARLRVRWNGGEHVLGEPRSDFLFLWGYERNFADEEFGYFVSNRNLGRDRLDFELLTRWPGGTVVRDLVRDETHVVNDEGGIPLSIERERAVLLVAEETAGE